MSCFLVTFEMNKLSFNLTWNIYCYSEVLIFRGAVVNGKILFCHFHYD